MRFELDNVSVIVIQVKNTKARNPLGLVHKMLGIDVRPWCRDGTVNLRDRHLWKVGDLDDGPKGAWVGNFSSG